MPERIRSNIPHVVLHEHLIPQPLPKAALIGMSTSNLTDEAMKGDGALEPGTSRVPNEPTTAPTLDEATEVPEAGLEHDESIDDMDPAIGKSVRRTRVTASN